MALNQTRKRSASVLMKITNENCHLPNLKISEHLIAGSVDNTERQAISNISSGSAKTGEEDLTEENSMYKFYSSALMQLLGFTLLKKAMENI